MLGSSRQASRIVTRIRRKASILLGASQAVVEDDASTTTSHGCRASGADSYFMGATPLLENCHGRAFLDSMKDYGYHLRYRLEQQHVPFADARLVPYTIVRACSIRSNGSTTIGSAAPACQRVTMNNIFVQGHPGFERLRNPVADQWRREMFSECLKRWPSWPRGIGAECPTVHGDHVG